MWGLLRSSRWPWVIVSLGVYFISVSGFVFDVVRNVPIVGFNPKTRSIDFWSPSGSSQYAVEGFVMGLHLLALAAVVLILTLVFPKVKDLGNRNLFVATGVATFAVVFMNETALFRYKNGAWKG
jgi:hypothetical protein